MMEFPTCPDCGRPIQLLPSGWWAHDGLPNGCWKLSFDGPDNDDQVRVGKDDIPL